MLITLSNLNQFSEFFAVKLSDKFAVKVIAKDPTAPYIVATLPCEILVSENKRQFEKTGIVINDRSQATVARHLRYCGIFNDNLLQVYCRVGL